MTNFSKILRKTDTKKRLSVPTKFFKSLPPFKGGHTMDFQAIDEGGEVWTFQCSVRKKGLYPKPVLSKGWLTFVNSKKLGVGHKINFFEDQDQTTATPIYRIHAEKEIKIFGAILGYAPL